MGIMGVSKKARRRSLLARVSLVVVSATMLALSACGAGNTSATQNKTPGVTPIGNAGTLIPGVLKWGEDSTGGMPYIAPKDANNPGADDYGFEVDIALAMSKLMNVTQQPTQITWSDWPQGLLSGPTARAAFSRRATSRVPDRSATRRDRAT